MLFSSAQYNSSHQLYSLLPLQQSAVHASPPPYRIHRRQTMQDSHSELYCADFCVVFASSRKFEIGLTRSAAYLPPEISILHSEIAFKPNPLSHIFLDSSLPRKSPRPLVSNGVHSHLALRISERIQQRHKAIRPTEHRLQIPIR